MSPDVEPIEALGHSITRQWYWQHQAVVYGYRSTERVAVDTWAEAVLADMRAWPAEKPFLALHDLRGVGMTPYSAYRSEMVGRALRKELHGRYAGLIDSGPVGSTIRFFAVSRLRRIMPQLESGFFFDFDEAMAWLQEKATPLEDH
jgi:hypothetical protein